jgi:hypothetical protein
MPLLLLVSVTTASYGAWPFDLVILMPVVIQAAVWTVEARRFSQTGISALIYAGINGGALVLNLMRFESMWFVWMAPALLVGYLVIRQLRTGYVAVPAKPARRLGHA